MTITNAARAIKETLIDRPIKELEAIAQTLKSEGFHLNVYKNPTPVVVCIVPVFTSSTTREYLTIKRNIAPAIGGIAFPGGYVDHMETVEEAAARELFEEVGISVSANDFKVFATDITPTNNLLIFAIHSGISKESIDWGHTNTEVQQICTSRVGDDLCFPLHTKMLNSLI